MDRRRVEGESWVSEDGRYAGEIVIAGKPPGPTLLLLMESQLRLVRDNLKRIREQ